MKTRERCLDTRLQPFAHHLKTILTFRFPLQELDESLFDVNTNCELWYVFKGGIYCIGIELAVAFKREQCLNEGSISLKIYKIYLHECLTLSWTCAIIEHTRCGQAFFC